MASSDPSLPPSTEVVYDLAIGGVYGRGVWRIGCAYGAVGRCKTPEFVENCELLLVVRLCLERPFTGANVTSEAERAAGLYS